MPYPYTRQIALSRRSVCLTELILCGLMLAMISEAMVQKAVDYLHSSCEEAAQARANRMYIESFLKTKRSELMVKSFLKSAIDREAEALSHPDYIELLHGMQAAIEFDELHRNKRQAAQIMIEAWQTMSANARAVKL